MEDPYEVCRLNLKFMDEEHVDSFINHGVLHMNTVKYFRGYNNGSVIARGDVYEGLDATYDPTRLNVHFNGIKLDPTGKIDARSAQQDHTNIFSLTRICDGHIWSSNKKRVLFVRKV